jgi:hypothetical protein
VIFLATIIIGSIYFKRRQRLRWQQARQRFTIDPDGSLGRDTEVEEVPGTLTPFTLLRPLNMLSRFNNKSSATAGPSAQPHTQEQLNTSVGLTQRADSEGRIGDTLVEIMQNMQNMQQRLLHIEGQLTGTGERAQDQEQNRQRLRRTSTTQSVENPFETSSEGTSDAPPTYNSEE